MRMQPRPPTNPYADVHAAYAEEIIERSHYPAPEGGVSPVGAYHVRNHADVGRGRDAGFRRAFSSAAA